MLIAESGSTKTEWRLIRNGVVAREFRSPGVNPNVLEPEAIEEIFRDAFEENLPAVPEAVTFYGAGLGADSQKAVVREIMQRVLPQSRIFVEHDMLAAARSTLRDEGIVCILGTGSNSARHHQHQITQNMGGHGWIFGDEGSGMDLGRHLLKGILQHDFPDEVQAHVERARGKSAYELKLDVHHSSKPNVRLAEFAVYVGETVHVPEVRQMVKARMLAFLDTTVCRYTGYRELYTDFVGSIAHHFSAVLFEACEERGVKPGMVLKDPVHNLVAFHLNHGMA